MRGLEALALARDRRADEAHARARHETPRLVDAASSTLAIGPTSGAASSAILAARVGAEESGVDVAAPGGNERHDAARAAATPCASAASELAPQRGARATSASASAVASPTRTPVNEPGPRSAAIQPSALGR